MHSEKVPEECHIHPGIPLNWRRGANDAVNRLLLAYPPFEMQQASAHMLRTQGIVQAVVVSAPGITTKHWGLLGEGNWPAS